jgi:hypothetical protein
MGKKKSIVLWFCGLIGFLLINAPGVQADITQKIMGEWKGNGTQYRGESWTIQLLVQPSGASSINYPSLKCGGDLFLLDQSETSARFRENIKYGAETGFTNPAFLASVFFSPRLSPDLSEGSWPS